MEKVSLTLAFLVSLLINTSAQYGMDLIDSASRSFCNGDNEAAIKYLKLYSGKYPECANTLLVNNRLGKFFIETKDFHSALLLLRSSLALEPKFGIMIPEADGCRLFERNDFSSAKADICITLSTAYQQLDDNGKALEYLNLADTKYLPHFGGCANGMINYRSYLSLKFAAFYLKTGDTAKGVNRLLQYFMSGEYYSLQVAQKLKDILRLKYSKKQIEEEIQRAITTIKHIKKIEDGETVNIFSFTLFGHTQQLPFHTLQDNKNFLRENENLNILKS